MERIAAVAAIGELRRMTDAAVVALMSVRLRVAPAVLTAIVCMPRRVAASAVR